MPVIAVGRDKLFHALGRQYSDDEFQALCFQYGVELDDVTTENQQLQKETAGAKDGGVLTGTVDNDEVLYKIDIPANRYDMLCLEGIARALNIFNTPAKSGVLYKLADMTGRPPLRLTIKAETALVRPFMVAAVLRGIKFDATRYKSFIDLQDKLHQNLCRQRSLVAIGTHDLATVQPPFTYEALPPEAISFVPLKQSKVFRADELMEFYAANDKKLGKFVPIIQDSVVYPVVMDSRRTVMSMPPIINGAHSAITLETTDVFIDVTATDLSKAKIVLNILCTMFSEYAAEPFTTEPVEVIDALGNSTLYPDLSPSKMTVPVSLINNYIGTDIPGHQLADSLSKMALSGTLSDDGTLVHVSVPPTRCDVLHTCDVIEDAAIAFGYNNIRGCMPSCVTVGQELPINELCEALRGEMAQAGYTEVLTWALVSHAENFGKLRRVDDGRSAVVLSNPATAEFEVCRTSLLPGALKTLSESRSNALPLRLFEVGDVVLLDEAAETGARNERRLCAVCCAHANTFEAMHGLLSWIMRALGVPARIPGQPIPEGTSEDRQPEKFKGFYTWEKSSDATFFEGRQATILAEGRSIGSFGIVHPEILTSFRIPAPVAALEINIEPFVFDHLHNRLPTHLAPC